MRGGIGERGDGERGGEGEGRIRESQKTLLLVCDVFFWLCFLLLLCFGAFL